MIDTFDIPDLLPRLVDRSLVSYDEVTGRYSLLETVRQYAAEHSLNASESSALRDRHFAFYNQFTENARQKVRGPEQLKWLQRFDDEYDNIRLAVDWALSSDSFFDEGVRLGYRLYDYWQVRGTFAEGQAVLDRIANSPQFGTMEHRCRHGLIQASVDYFRQEPEVLPAMEGLALARELGDPILYGDALCIGILGLLRVGRLDEARELQEPALKALAEVGDHVMSAFVEINFGNAAFAAGNLEEAETHFKECLRIRKGAQDLRGVGAALGSLGYVAEAHGRIEEAIQLYRQATAIILAVGSGWDVGGTLPANCLELTLAGRYEDAALTLGFAEGDIKKVGGERDHVDGPVFDRWVLVVREKLGEEKFASLFRAGMQMNTGAVRDMVLPPGTRIDVFGDEDALSAER